ncbi:MAG TPA: 23S rRNA (adenine(2030)-N(6))-methyltransferase RlmJ [Vitreimonas sp.]|uniref:23S rRNA (adenine(2030)-N(6))-methyltransferase RlmJ n=1 Tax=Vitreimonas sp. TaxID=3069702 RepID=UPI002D59B55A|nr:23S rRNA (adenine(2030)-N(6))-methyltransferase RlmJ [Vitreimonas sp.]HYD88739.1 23S rRNA (adenine(2030)-N(6))-methyltransferase RlmJ [Vitreimonas sp.]
MNYRHAFHVGNHADVLKHAVLLFCLNALKRKPAPFAVLDTHAGRGLYDLAGEEAERSPEWRDGVGRLWSWPEPPPLVARYLEAVRGFNQDGNLRVYPGSPALATTQLRLDDVLMACELHPEEHAALRRSLPRQPNVQVHARDGWEALGALLPPPQRRGLVLIDPPYEAPDELTLSARAIGGALRRFGHGSYLWWRPLKSESALAAADAEARAQGAKETLRADLWTAAPSPEGRLVGSSVFLINPPFGLADELLEALPFLADALTKGQSGWRLAPS